MKKQLLVSLMLIFLFSISLYAQQSNAWLGMRYRPVSDSLPPGLSPEKAKGLWVQEVLGGTSLSLKLQPGDRLLKLYNKELNTTEQLRQLMPTIPVGQDIKAEVIRQGKRVVLTGKAVARPAESGLRSTLERTTAPFGNGQLGVLINRPAGSSGKRPALLFIPGYTCTSIENLDTTHPYRRILQGFIDAGYLTLRIEKPGLGRSTNTKACSECDLKEEIESFRVGLNYLKSLPDIDPNRIFIFGHSMGGVIAPAIAAGQKLAGIMVFGTTAKSWFEYQVEMYRLQIMLAKPDPMDYERICREQARVAYRYFIQKESLADMAKDPAIDSLLRTTWEYDGKGRISGRNAEFWRQIQDMPLLDNWKNALSPVLVMFGESDFQAFSLADHQQIAYTVNHYRPGTAKVVRFPETDHYFARSGSMQQAYDLFASQQYQRLFQLFNPEVSQSAVRWANEQPSIQP